MRLSPRKSNSYIDMFDLGHSSGCNTERQSLFGDNQINEETIRKRHKKERFRWYDPELVERAEIIRDKGTNRQRYFRGEVDKYTWVEIGSSYVPSEICSAFLYAQLEEMDRISEARRAAYLRYRRALKGVEARGLLQLPQIPEDCDSNYHLFYVLFPTEVLRDQLLHEMRSRKISAVFHYVPLHSSPMGKQLCGELHLPQTEQLSTRLLRLPFFFEITEQQQSEVVSVLEEILLAGQQTSTAVRS